MVADVITPDIISIPWFQEIESIKTLKGSIYTFLPDGTTQRYQKSEEILHEPQAAICFIPDYETIKKTAPPDFDVEEILGENEVQYEQLLLKYAQMKGYKIYVVGYDADESPHRLETNQEIADVINGGGRIFLSFGTKGKVDFMLPVSAYPKVGYYTFDTRLFRDPKTGEMMRERHIGNKIVQITNRENE